jgi:hypothetical protein
VRNGGYGHVTFDMGCKISIAQKGIAVEAPPVPRGKTTQKRSKRPVECRLGLAELLRGARGVHKRPVAGTVSFDNSLRAPPGGILMVCPKFGASNARSNCDGHHSIQVVKPIGSLMTNGQCFLNRLPEQVYEAALFKHVLANGPPPRHGVSRKPAIADRKEASFSDLL